MHVRPPVEDSPPCRVGTRVPTWTNEDELAGLVRRGREVAISLQELTERMNGLIDRFERLLGERFHHLPAGASVPLAEGRLMVFDPTLRQLKFVVGRQVSPLRNASRKIRMLALTRFQPLWEACELVASTDPFGPSPGKSAGPPR